MSKMRPSRKHRSSGCSSDSASGPSRSMHPWVIFRAALPPAAFRDGGFHFRRNALLFEPLGAQDRQQSGFENRFQPDETIDDGRAAAHTAAIADFDSALSEFFPREIERSARDAQSHRADHR